jgi:hypothetical protein
VGRHLRSRCPLFELELDDDPLDQKSLMRVARLSGARTCPRLQRAPLPNSEIVSSKTTAVVAAALKY